MTRLLDGMPYDLSISTDIRRRFKTEGFVPPEHSAVEQEQQARYEGALRCMQRIQEEGWFHPKVTRLDAWRKTK